MNSKAIRRVRFSDVRIVLMFALILCRALAVNALDVQNQNGVAYLSGGVGTDERAAMQAMSAKFNLKVTLAMSSGALAGEAAIRIVDSHEHTVFEMTPDGPLLYVQLPAGDYAVHATRDGKTIDRTAHVSTGGQTAVAFTWSGE